MRPILEYIEESEVNREVVDEAVRSLPKIASPDLMTIVLTGDFRRSVVERLEAESPHTPYSQRRTTGLVGAKSMHSDDGTSTIVVLGGPFLRGQEHVARSMNMNRLLRHEGWHVVLHQRDEEVNQIYRALPEDMPESDLHLAGVGAVGVTEYRIERQLWEEGSSTPDRAGETIEILSEIRDALRDAIEVKHAGENIRRTFETALGVFNQLVTHLCYVAAEDPQVRRRPLAEVAAEPDWERLVAGFWERLLIALDRIPVAGTAQNSSDLAAVLEDLIPLLREWLGNIGFSLEERGGGPYFDVLRQDF